MIEQDLATPVELPGGVTPSPPPDGVGQGLVDFSHAIGAADRAFQFDQDIFARQNALSAAADRRNFDIQRTTGTSLENPLEGGYRKEARERLFTGGETGHIQDVQLRIHQERLDALAQQFPEHAAIIGADRPLLADAKQLADYWSARAARGEPGLNATAGLAAGFIGGTIGFFRNPINVASLLIGGGELKAGSLALRIGEAGLRQAGVNAGLQAAAEPGVQAWRGERGHEAGVKEAAKDIGLAALFGFVPGAGLEAAKTAAPALRGLFRGAEADAAAFADPPAAKGLQEAVEQALRHGEGASEALPEMPAGRAEPLSDSLAGMFDDETGPPQPIALDHDARAAIAYETADRQTPTSGAEPPSQAIELRARELSPKAFARADELDNRLAGARAEIQRVLDMPRPTDIFQTRIARLEQELSAITGKRRSSPRAKAMREQLDALYMQRGEASGTFDRLRADQMSTLRMSIVDLENRRAALGPKLRAVRAHAAQMLGARFDDGPIADPFAAAARLRREPRLVESALASDAPDIRAAGRLASLGDAAFEEARSGRVDIDTALATAARVSNEAEQLAVMRGAAAERPIGADDAAAAVTREMETRATPQALAALHGAEPAVPPPKFPRDIAKGADEQIEALSAQIERDAADLDPIIIVKPKRKVTRKNPTLFEELASAGGLAPHPELQRIFDGNPFVPGFGRLIRKDGMKLDDAFAAAKEMGFFHDPAEHGVGELTLDWRDLLDKLRDEAHGSKVYRIGQEPPSPAALAAQAEAKARHGEAMKALKAVRELQPEDLGDGIVGWTPKPEILDRAAWLMVEDHSLEPLAAWDRAAVAYERELWAQVDQFEPVQKGRVDEWGPIPGWDEELPFDAAAASPERGAAAPAEGGNAAEGRLSRETGDGLGGDGGAHREVSADPLDLVPGDGGRLVAAQDALTEPTRAEMIASVVTRCPF